MNGAAQKPIEEANVWIRDSFDSEREWIIELSPSAINDIEKAVDAAADAGHAPQDLRPETFPLPRLKATLSDIYEIMENGRGFTVVRGWPSERHNHQENLLAFCGIASYFGEAKVQNYEGEPIVGVIDKDKPYYHTSRG